MRFWSLFKRILKRGEDGQSIIILALGFIALAAFVGITTDISVAFVRYNQLSRAVDSAAIAAANQMRQDTSHATIGLAARQFIEFHGINPEEVDVLTCQTRPDDPELRCDPTRDERSKLVRVVARIQSPTFFMRLLGFNNFDLWASSISQTASLDVVLIMDVSDAMASETTYADWVGVETIGDFFGDVAKVENLGVVYRPPTAEEIINRKVTDDPFTTPTECTYRRGTQPSEVLLSIMNCFWLSEDDEDLGFPGLLHAPQIEVNNRLHYVNVGIDSPTGGGLLNQDTDPDYIVYADRFFFDANRQPAHLTGQTGIEQAHPREECRVRFYPGSITYPAHIYRGYTDTNGDLIGLDQVYQQHPSIPRLDTVQDRFEGFVPVHNFYGCCNDPDGDLSFADLVCQPFKQVRNASFQFLERIDFVRGDRVAFVTFDRSAFLINPYGFFSDDPDSQPGAMLSSSRDAFVALRDLVGVRAEPNFYVFDSGEIPVDVDADGNRVALSEPTTATWTGFAAGRDEQGRSITINYGATGFDPRDATEPASFLYPVFDSCPFSNASLNRNRTLFDFALSNISLPNHFSPDGDPGWLRWPVHNSPGAPYPPADVDGGGLTFSLPDDPQRRMDIRRSYDFWASCAGKNIGAALREGNNAFLNPQTVRRFGTIWVMVLLSDGAAGASDPVRRNGFKLTPSNPYQELDGQYGVPGQYGAFGVCPYGTPDNPGRLVSPELFPFCSSGEPWERHDCDFRPRLTLPPFNDTTALRDRDYRPYDPDDPDGPPSPEAELSWNRDRNNFYDIDIGAIGENPARCHELYDVDDYARDWADHIGLQSRQASEDTLLPTIFTIGFRLPYRNREFNGQILDLTDENAITLCRLNPGDCTGEQTLRYIADVGDNNKIDNHYWKDWHESPFLDREILGYLEFDTFGPRDPCQRADQTHSGGSYAAINAPTNQLSDEEKFIQYGMLAPQTSCGNYFFAPDGNELRFVFDEIASRMFTRLAR